MQLKLAKTLWGCDGADDPTKWDALFARIKSEGFDGIEAITLSWRKDPALFKSLLAKHELALICQIHTTGGGLSSTGEYEYCTSNKLHDHLGSFIALTREAAELGPVLINSHSGHDSWGSGSNAVSFFKSALKVEAALGVPVVHETHRQRLLFSPYQTAELLAKPELGALRINADLSHWCCVCEKVFDEADPRDDWWPATLELVARHCGLVHARVGHAEGPQVSDPDAAEFSSEVEAHCRWWRAIWQAAERRGEGSVWAEPEFGPPPYLQTLPHTRMPVSDLWGVNSRVAARLRLEFEAAMQAPAVAAAGPGSAAPTAGFYAVDEGIHRPLTEVEKGAHARLAAQANTTEGLFRRPPTQPAPPPAVAEAIKKGPLLGEASSVGEAISRIGTLAD